MKVRYRSLLILAQCVCLVACVNVGSQRIGQSSYAPLADNENVVVFTAADQIKGKYEVVGIISYNNAGKYQILTLESAIEPMKAQARALGANAIIIDKSQPVKSGIISTGMYVEARAIRLEMTP